MLSAIKPGCCTVDGSLQAVVLHVDFREVQDALQIKWIIHVQVYPEQRLLVIPEHLAVEALIIFLAALIGMLVPQRIGVV